MKIETMKRILFCVLLSFALMSQATAQPSVDVPEGAWAEKSAFVGPETVAVGCGAGLLAGGFAAVLPAIAPLPGQSTLVTLPITLAWGTIGCGVGIVAGASAVIAQWLLDQTK